MNKEEKRNYLGNISVEDDIMSDNLAIVLVSYFEKHIDCPENDPPYEDTEWGTWAIEKMNQALDLIAEVVEIKP